MRILANFSIAHHLPYSNYIVALNEDGAIVEKGFYDELVAAKGYISSLNSTASRVNTERAPDVVLDDETLQELNLPEDDNADDTSRQTGDWSVYMYYFQHIGWSLLALFVGLCAFFVLCMIAPRESIRNLG
jgi:hypothetical protein